MLSNFFKRFSSEKQINKFDTQEEKNIYQLENILIKEKKFKEQFIEFIGKKKLQYLHLKLDFNEYYDEMGNQKISLEK